MGGVDGVRATPGAVAAAVGQVANWFFVVTGQSYAEQFASPSPVAHFWSLAVEEQFYLVLPLVVVGVQRCTRSWRAMATVLAAGALVSTATMVVLFHRGASIDRLYFGTDTRAAELLVGCVLAVVLHHRPLRPSPGAARVLGGAGIVALVATLAAWSALELSDAVLYRGGFLVVSLVSVLLIASVVAGAGPAAALVRGPLPAVGRVSYGLYLFHWPVFLWLDEASTGLAAVPLLVLRLTVTAALATASYHLVEMPIRNGWRPAVRGGLRWAAAPAALVIVVAAVVVGPVPPGESGSAGLGRPVAAAPVAPPRVDDVLDVVVVADGSGAELTDDLLAAADGDPHLAVTVAEPWRCDGMAIGAGDPLCTNWRAEWPALVERSDADVVLLHLTAWDPAEVAALSGLDDPTLQSAWVHGVLGAAFDLLTSGGATVVWNQSPFDVETALRSQHDPFHTAVQRLTRERSDARRLPVPRLAAAELVPDLALYQRSGEGDVPRVLVVGDSVAASLGYGLERWAAEEGTAVVWSVATEGCGTVHDGWVRDLSGRERPFAERCGGVRAGWQAQVDEFDPDVVVVLSNAWDHQPRRLDGWDAHRGPGDAAFDDHLVDRAIAAYDTLSSAGATVLWLEPPCARDDRGMLGIASGGDPMAPERIRYLRDEVLRRLGLARPALQTFDLDAVLCPGGVPLEEVPGAGEVRPDGLHLSPAASRWLADTHGEALLASALG